MVALIPVALLLSNLVDYSYYVPAIMLLFWIGIYSSLPHSGTPRPFWSIPHLAVSGVIVLVLIFIGINKTMSYAAIQNYERAQTALERNDINGALIAINSAIERDPVPSVFYAKQAEIYFRKYTETREPTIIAQAIKSQQEALQRYPTSAVYWSDRAFLELTNNNREGALEAMNHAIRLDKFNPRYQESLRSLAKKNHSKT